MRRSEPAGDAVLMSSEDVEKLINSVLGGFFIWYDWQSSHQDSRSRHLRLASIVLGALTTIVAAFPDQVVPLSNAHLWTKWIVVTLSAVATVTSGYLSRVSALYRLREAGRVGMRLLEQEMKAALSVPLTAGQVRDLRQRIAIEAAALERSFGGNPSEGAATATPRPQVTG